MKKAMTVIFSLFLVLASCGLSLAADKDVKGGKDHPLLSRMPDFHIVEYKDKDFESHKFLGADGKHLPVEGHFYYIKYFLNKGAAQPGELKIIRNIQDALKKIGGQVVHERHRYSSITVQKDDKETWVEVKAYPAEYSLTIVEKGAMKQEVVADAAAMGNDINTTGHVSVYGIYFDFGKSDIKPESDAAISEIAKLLKNNGELKLYVVGHTDNVGSFDANMKLSRDRADAVVKVLAGKHGIAAARLKPYGVASLAPVTSNDTDGGRAKNRRVELVKQ
ncbi:MAG: OmpA family protein [Deltaproteobacteria bacterium]|nr:MAG: OmpA family protein [Deltaproteobacteria bacterium]